MALIFLVFSVMPAFATATTVMETLWLKPFGEIKGKFTQTKTINELQISLITEGTYHLQKHTDISVLIWTIQKPQKSEICMDELGVTFSPASGKKKHIKFTEVPDEIGDQIAILGKLLGGDQAKLLEFFEVKKTNNSFKLTPKVGKPSVATHIDLKVHEKGYVESVYLEEKNKDITSINFSNTKSLQKKDFPKNEYLKCLK